MAEEDPTMSRQSREPTSETVLSNTESTLPIRTLRDLSDELYVTKTEPQLEYLYNFLNENGDFPRILIDERNTLSSVFWTKWSSGGRTNRPSNLYDNILRAMVGGDYERWRIENEQKFFENVYRVLLKPIPDSLPEEEEENDGGSKRTKRTKRTKKPKRRKTRKFRKNKRKTKRRRPY
jgi:hypothetical protein